MADLARFRDSNWQSILEMLVRDPGREPTLNALAHLACREIGADRATVFVVDRTRGLLEGVVAVGTDGQPLRVPLDFGSIAGFVALTGRAVRVDDVTVGLEAIDPRLRFYARVDRLLGYATRSVLAVPVRARGEIIGVLELLNAAAGRFQEEDEDRLEDLAAIAGIVLHVSSLYEDLKELRQLERRKSDFIDMLVHELKEPVAAIQMLAEFAMSEAQDPAERLALLERIVVRSGQVTSVVGELLEVSRVKRGLVLGEVRPVQLGEIALAAARGLDDLAKRRNVSMTVEVPADLPPARLDDALAPYLFTNLLTNALKYTDGGGSVRLTLRPETEGILIEATDTGIGVPPGELRRLFSEFYRASNARARGVDGTGLGLVAVKEIAERFGGRVGVDSEVGKGSRFWIWLPAARLNGATTPPPV